MEELLLQIENLKVAFHTDEGIVKALDGISLEISNGEILGIVGETGCGKSVTANAIVRLIPSPPGVIEGGQIIFKKRNLLELTEEELRRIRGAEIAMIFQDPFTSLNPVHTVGRQIMESISLHHNLRGPSLLDKAIEMMAAVGIPEASKRVNDYPHKFSGGMRQRVMIAMALSCDPDLLIADEPTTALDVTIQAQILDIMESLNHGQGTSILLISHDLGIISALCNKVAVMYSGNIVETAEVESFFSEIRHPYTQGLLGAIPRIRERRETLSIIPGQIPDLIFPPSGCRYHPRCPYVMDRCQNEKPQLTEIAPMHRVACFKVHG